MLRGVARITLNKMPLINVDPFEKNLHMGSY
jgi:hypothetical protein